MSTDFEAELRVARAEGLLSKEEEHALREDARQLRRSPLDLLRERGRITDGTLASLIADVRGIGGPAPATPETASAPALPVEVDPNRTATLVGEAAAPAPLEPDRTETVDCGVARPAPKADPVFPMADWDRYQSIRFLGQGGMGQVFLAYDPRLRRNVALKFVRGDDSELARRLIAEARAQARVNHERVCKVYEVGEVRGRIFIAMQYIDGQPLSALGTDLSVERRVMVLREAAQGVHEAHRVGLIHRDLKPSNIMVERAEDGALRSYVMDFGLARDWNESTTADGTVLGTPHFMSPEQARGELATLDRRADVYSLGATLYHLLTGQYPVPGRNGLEVVSQISTHEPRSPRAINPNIPIDLEAITLKCLEKDRSARYESARALAEDLDRFLSGEPVGARAVGGWYRFSKKLRKHRSLVAVAAVALALIVLSMGWAGLQRREVRLREQLARRFTEQVERVEAMARYSDLTRLHDIRLDHASLRARMDELAEEIRQNGDQAVGPGRYALGRGYLALGEEVQAREHLEAAWRSGFREPRVAYALALVTGHQYQAQLLEAERIQDSARRDALKRELERRLRAPALEYLQQSQGADVPSPRYVAALIAFYEGRTDEALDHVDAIGHKLPWFYEGPKLRGDILLARASRLANEGKRELALSDFEAGRKAYTQAVALGESVPELHDALAELEYTNLVMELYSKGEVSPPSSRGLEALSRALTVNPDDYRAHLLEARFYRRLAEFRSNRGEDTAGLHEKSISAAQTALSLAPALGEARLELSRCLWRWGQTLSDRHRDPREHLGKAIEILEALSLAERSDDVYVQLGLSFQTWADYESQVGEDSLGHRGQAIASYQDALKVNDRLPDVWIDLGITLFTRASHPKSADPGGDLAQARAALEKALVLNPQHIVACFYAGQVQEALAQRLLDRGEDARPSWDQALDLYRRGVTINPAVPQLHNAMGLVLIRQAREAWNRGGDPFPFLSQARTIFEQATAVAPQHGLGELNVGEMLAQRARYLRAQGKEPFSSLREATQILEAAAPRLADSALFWSNLGVVHALEALSKLEYGEDPRPALVQAGAALQRVFEKNPSYAEAWFYHGEVLGTRARWEASRHRGQEEEFQAAARAYEKALELAPEQQEFRLAFGHFYRVWGDWRRSSGKDARQVLERGLGLAEQVLSNNPGSPDARLLRAGLRLGLADYGAPTGQTQGWREDSSQALSANPNLEHDWKEILAGARWAASGP